MQVVETSSAVYVVLCLTLLQKEQSFQDSWYHLYASFAQRYIDSNSTIHHNGSYSEELTRIVLMFLTRKHCSSTMVLILTSSLIQICLSQACQNLKNVWKKALKMLNHLLKAKKKMQSKKNVEDILSL